MIKTYAELCQLKTYKERFEYLKLNGQVANTTFGFDRYMNQLFYKSSIWNKIRREVIIRDKGLDLGIEEYEIRGSIIVHHMNPISIDDLSNATEYLIDPKYLISVSLSTHNAIHYGKELPNINVERYSGDTCLWKRTRR